MHLANYLGLVHKAEIELAEAYRQVAEEHSRESDVHRQCLVFAGQCNLHAERLLPFAQRYGEDAPSEPERLHSDLFKGTRSGGLALLRDLHDLYLMATEVDISW